MHRLFSVKLNVRSTALQGISMIVMRYIRIVRRHDLFMYALVDRHNSMSYRQRDNSSLAPPSEHPRHGMRSGAVVSHSTSKVLSPLESDTVIA